jgi:hypothetical protein
LGSPVLFIEFGAIAKGTMIWATSARFKAYSIFSFESCKEVQNQSLAYYG